MRGKCHIARVRWPNLVTALLLSLLTGCGENEESNELPELPWQPTAPTGTTFIQVILATPDDRLYIGTSGDGILRSDNGGNSWIRSGLEGYKIISLAYSETALFAGADVEYINEHGELIPTKGGLFRSDDGGIRWIPLGFERSSVCLLLVIGKTIFAANDREGLLRSDDNGNTWRQIPGLRTPMSLAVAKGILFVIDEGGKRFSKSADLGDSWQIIDFPNWPQDVVAGDSDLFVVRHFGVEQKMIYRSTDLGETWTHIGYLHLPQSPLVLDSAFYAGVRGVMRWTPRRGWESVGLENYEISSLSASDNYLYAATWSGEVFRARLPR